MPKWIWKVIAVAIISLAVLFIFSLDEYSFNDASIASTADSIRSEYAKKDVEITGIKLIRENSRKLTGFVTIKMLGNEVTQKCEAHMDKKDGSFFWRCGL